MTTTTGSLSSGPRRSRAIFFGSPHFAVPALQRIAAATQLLAVVTQPDRPAGRGQALVQSPVKEAARVLAPGVPILQPEKIRTGELEATLRSFGADVFVVVAYGRILPAAILELPARGPWNVHASILPRLRGAAPIQWAVINGDERTGVSLMRMEVGLDTGPVAAVSTTPIRDDDTAGTLSERLSVLGADLLSATLPRILDGSVVPEPQDDGAATLAPILRKEDGRLDFTRPARLVAARARGVDPWPGATALLDGQTVKLFAPRTVTLGSGGGGSGPGGPGGPVVPVGTIVGIDEAGMQVVCGDDSRVLFRELQLPGRKRLAAAAAAAGRSIAVGNRFA